MIKSQVEWQGNRLKSLFTLEREPLPLAFKRFDKIANMVNTSPSSLKSRPMPAVTTWIDETDHPLVLAAALASDGNCFRKVMKRLRREYPRIFAQHTEFKASRFRPEIIGKLLRWVAECDFEIYTQTAPGARQDYLERYKMALSALMVQVWGRHQSTHLVLHRISNDTNVRKAIAKFLVASAEAQGIGLTEEDIDQRPARGCAELEIVDAIAWAHQQRLKAGQYRGLFALVEGKVMKPKKRRRK